MSDKNGIIVGFWTGKSWPNPRIPSQLLPQAHTSPRAVNTNTWSGPVATSVTIWPWNSNIYKVKVHFNDNNNFNTIGYIYCFGNQFFST